MGHKHPFRPQRLAAKLLQIRRSLGLSQSQFAILLNRGITSARISEYESGKREPSLITLLTYAYMVGFSTDDLIDDSRDLPAQKRRRRKRILR